MKEVSGGMALVWLALAWICMGLGVIRVKCANNSRLRRQWYHLSPGAKLVCALAEPFVALVRGWETVVVVLWAALTGQEVDLEPEDGADDAGE